MVFSRRQWLWGAGALVLVAVLGGIFFFMKTSSADTIRAQCYEQAVQRRRVVDTSTNSSAYLDQITEDALKNQSNDAAAFVACEQAAKLASPDIQTLAGYEAANHFTK